MRTNNNNKLMPKTHSHTRFGKQLSGLVWLPFKVIQSGKYPRPPPFPLLISFQRDGNMRKK